MNPDLIMLIVSLVVGFSLFFMIISKKVTSSKAYYSLLAFQFLVILSVSMFMLNLGLIDTFTSTFGLITLLMLILVLTISSTKKK